MEQLPIVRKRVRIWPVLLALLVIAILVAAALYVMGDRPVNDVGVLMQTIGGTAARIPPDV